MVREADLLIRGTIREEHGPSNPLVPPLYGDYRGLPSLLIRGRRGEILLDDSMRVAERAKKPECWWTSKCGMMVHVWHVFAKLLPEGQQAIEKMGAYVNAHTP